MERTFGGTTITHALSLTAIDPSLNMTDAVTGPSEVSSNHPSLFAKFSSLYLFLSPSLQSDLPKPPRTISLPFSLVRSSPSGTSTPWNWNRHDDDDMASYINMTCIDMQILYLFSLQRDPLFCPFKE